jgi:hypothetical protein
MNRKIDSTAARQGFADMNFEKLQTRVEIVQFQFAQMSYLKFLGSSLHLEFQLVHWIITQPLI